MSKPLVCAVMLVNGRAEMVKRAIASFQAQTYQRALLILWDNSIDRTTAYPLPDSGVWFIEQPNTTGKTIGELRNDANMWACNGPQPLPDIFVHWDSDDWSHPRRIEEQVTLLEQSKADAVGYRDMLFWRTCDKCNAGRSNTLPECPYCHLAYDPSRETPIGEAWLYRHKSQNYCLGTSLCYWRKVWEQVPFLALPNAQGATGEEYNWLKKVHAVAVTSIRVERSPARISSEALQAGAVAELEDPRMIASIHGGNTQYYGSDMLTSYTEFWRAPIWDEHCRKVMAL